SMNPVKPTDYIAVDHVDDRFSYSLVDALESIHAFLYQHITDLQTFFDRGHLVALLAVELINLTAVLDTHDPHTVSPGIRLDNDKRFFLDTVLCIFFLNLPQNFVNCYSYAIFSFFLVKIDLAAR